MSVGDIFVAEKRKRENGQRYLAWGSIAKISNIPIIECVCQLLRRNPVAGIDVIIGDSFLKCNLATQIQKELADQPEYAIW